MPSASSLTFRFAPSFFVGLSIALASCAHYPDVRPGENHVHQAIFKVERKGDGFQRAFGQAKDFCEDVYKKRPVKVSESTQYVGTMDEGTYNAAKTASKVMTGVGAAAAVFGGKRESGTGVVAGSGGAIADNAIGADYEYTLTFKCQ